MPPFRAAFLSCSVQLSGEKTFDRVLSGRLLGTLFAAAGTLADRLSVEQHLHVKMLVVVGAGLAGQS